MLLYSSLFYIQVRARALDCCTSFLPDFSTVRYYDPTNQVGIALARAPVSYIGLAPGVPGANTPETPGQIQQVDPPKDSIICSIGVSPSRIGGSMLWILPRRGSGTWAYMIAHIICKQI